MDTDYRPLCVQDLSFNRITRSDAHINVTNKRLPQEQEANVKIGYWYNTLSSEEHAPLFTRYQPPKLCGKGSPALETPQCTIPANLSRFDPYNDRFRFAGRHRVDLASLLQHQTGRNKVCFIGASHAGVLIEQTSVIVNAAFINETANATGQGKPVVEIGPFHYTKFVNHLTKARMQQYVDMQCTKVVIGTGQWDASKFRPPTLFVDFERMLEEAMAGMVEVFSNAGVDFYFRSMHYNPLGNLIGACPVQDWRNPPVVDMYNQIIRLSAAKFNITLIDTAYITGIMWDGAPDWCHFRNTAGEMEARYILGRIFSE